MVESNHSSKSLAFRRLAGRVALAAAVATGARTLSQEGQSFPKAQIADAAANPTATPDYSFDAGKFLPKPNVVAQQNKLTKVPAGEICLGDVVVKAGRVINNVYDSASQTALIIETTTKAKTTQVSIKPPFGDVACYPDSKTNLKLLKTAAQTVDDKLDKRIIVDVIQEPSNKIQPRNRTFTWAPPSTDGSYPYVAKKEFSLKKGFAVLGDLEQKDPKTGVLKPTYDSNANTAEIVIAKTDGVVVENIFGSGSAVPADAKHLAALKAQVPTTVRVDINYLNNKSVSVEGGTTQATTVAATPITESTPVATATALPTSTEVPATSTAAIPAIATPMPSLQYSQNVNFTLPAGYEVQGDLVCQNAAGQMEQTADGTGTTATLVQANQGKSDVCINPFGAGWMLPINDADTAQLASQTGGKSLRPISVPQSN